MLVRHFDKSDIFGIAQCTAVRWDIYVTRFVAMPTTAKLRNARFVGAVKSIAHSQGDQVAVLLGGVWIVTVALWRVFWKKDKFAA